MINGPGSQRGADRRLARVAARHEQALATARQIGSPYVEAIAGAGLGLARLAGGHRDTCIGTFAEAIRVADATVDAEARVLARSCLARARLEAGEPTPRWL